MYIFPYKVYTPYFRKLSLMFMKNILRYKILKHKTFKNVLCFVKNIKHFLIVSQAHID